MLKKSGSLAGSFSRGFSKRDEPPECCVHRGHSNHSNRRSGRCGRAPRASPKASARFSGYTAALTGLAARNLKSEFTPKDSPSSTQPTSGGSSSVGYEVAKTAKSVLPWSAPNLQPSPQTRLRRAAPQTSSAIARRLWHYGSRLTSDTPGRTLPAWRNIAMCSRR